MLFNSFNFLVFFPIVTIIYFLLPHKFRWFHLLVASCVFYMYFIPVYILILIFTIIIDYIAGIYIENATGGNRKLFLVMSLIANIGVLCVFKYYNFFVTNLDHLLLTSHLPVSLPLLNMILPIGLSFHTFQAMSYTIEVYRSNQKAERHFGIYALYVMFYPQLVAGPIERPQNMLHQFHERHDFNWENFISGLKLILWGFFKKILIADRLLLVVDNVYNHPRGHNGLEMVIATVFFAFQIYCDFSGYSDIALGTARVLGINLMVNFNKPYQSKSLSEFWKRWHISLSSWFYDYLFDPIAIIFRDYGKKAIMFGLLTTFLISGLWHGAAWHYIVWGGLHGIALVYELLTRKKRKSILKKMSKPLGNFITTFCTFCYVCFGYIFFRANSLSDARCIVTNLFTGWHLKSFSFYKYVITSLGGGDLIYGIFNLSIGLILIILLIIIEKMSGNLHPVSYFDTKPKHVSVLIYFVMIIAISILGMYDNKEFIYFQF